MLTEITEIDVLTVKLILPDLKHEKPAALSALLRSLKYCFDK